MLLPLIISALAQGSNVAPVATLVLPSKPVMPGKPFKATLKMVFADGLHGYQNPPADPLEIPVVVKLKSGGARLISVTYPKGVTFGQPPVKVYSGAVNIALSMKAGKKSGPVSLVVNYQQCTASACFPPADLIVKANLAVLGR